MKKIRRAGCMIAAAAILFLCCPNAVNGAQTLGQAASEMTALNPDYESRGETVMGALEARGRPDGFIKTAVCFDLAEEAHSFGKYFYRYIYLGKEPVTLHAAETSGEYEIYLTCRDPGAAARQHRQVQDKLTRIVEAGKGMGDRELADYFYGWVYDNVAYDQSLQNTTVYDAVIGGNAVCWGYVGAYLSLCRSAGLVCEPVYRADHAWNRVWLDGEWNYCDITWDKSLGGSSRRFLTQEEMDSDPMHNTL